MGTPSSTHTRMTSWRSIPSSFDSSSGVRWFGMLAPFDAEKSPSGTRPSGLLAASVVVAEIQRSAVLQKRISSISIIGPEDAEQPFFARVHGGPHGHPGSAPALVRGGPGAVRRSA